MVSVKAITVVASILLVTEQALASPNRLKNCSNPCFTRFGQKICCDRIHENDPPRCPKTPRILFDCEDKDIMVKSIEVTPCNTNDDCGNRELCCNDVCHSGPPKICIKSDVVNDQYFLHGLA
ncbi:uncharacterized protein [Palaemon carinicauda]|uniref:uncharacterized protein n=1 Tax=Palaemon carinicauda TaxID=392227 RepID=UPI0035B5C580